MQESRYNLLPPSTFLDPHEQYLYAKVVKVKSHPPPCYLFSDFAPLLLESCQVVPNPGSLDLRSRE